MMVIVKTVIIIIMILKINFPQVEQRSSIPQMWTRRNAWSMSSIMISMIIMIIMIVIRITMIMLFVMMISKIWTIMMILMMIMTRYAKKAALFATENKSVKLPHTEWALIPRGRHHQHRCCRRCRCCQHHYHCPHQALHMHSF